MAAPPGGQFTYQGRRSAVRDVRRSTHDGAVAFRGQYINVRCDMATLYILKNSSQNKKRRPVGDLVCKLWRRIKVPEKREEENCECDQ